MNNIIDEILRIDSDLVKGKWANIRIYNLLDEIPKNQRESALIELSKRLLSFKEARYNKVIELDAPDCIIKNELNSLRKLQKGNHFILNRLRKIIEVQDE